MDPTKIDLKIMCSEMCKFNNGSLDQRHRGWPNRFIIKL